MSIAPEGMLLIEGISPDVEDALASAVVDLQLSGVSCTFSYREPRPQAALEWLMPTAVGIWFLDKYFGAMVGEEAKGHYKSFKTGIQKIYDRTLGPQKSVTRVVRQGGGAIRPDRLFSGNLSYIYKGAEGWRVKLLFPLDISPEQYERSCVEFAKLLRLYQQQPAESPLAVEIEYQAKAKSELLPQKYRTLQNRSSLSLLVYWDDTKKLFYVADPSASSRTSSLVSWPLGGRA